MKNFKTQEAKKKNPIFSFWVLLAFVLTFVGFLIAFDYIPVADYLKFSKPNSIDDKTLLQKMQQDILDLQQALEDSKKEHESMGADFQQSMSLLPKMQKDLQELNRKAFWFLLVNRLSKKVYEGAPYDRILDQVQEALPQDAVNLDALRVFAASGIPMDDDILKSLRALEKPTSVVTQNTFLEKVLAFFKNLLVIKKVEDSDAMNDIIALIEAHKLSEALVVIQQKIPDNQELIILVQNKLNALNTLEDLEFFITSNLQATNVL